MKAKKLGEFLKAKRSQIVPAELGLPESGGRRVSGLRRDEVATRASISTDHYLRIEQGRRKASPEVLEAIATVLMLSPEERAYVFRLSESGNQARVTNRNEPALIPRGVRQTIDSMKHPAVVHNTRLDILELNRLGRALYSDLLERQPIRPNLARYAFLEPSSRDFLPDWEDLADQAVASLRWKSAHSSPDDDLTELIAELAASGDEFKRRWDSQSVAITRPGSVRINHPVIGMMTLNYASMEIRGSNGVVLTCLTADAGSPAERALKALEDWATVREAQAGDLVEALTGGIPPHDGEKIDSQHVS